MRSARLALLLVFGTAASALVGGCQPPDVGARCEIQWGTSSPVPAPTPSTIAGDYLETGNYSCDDQVCIVSPATSGKYSGCQGSQCGYCSKPCTSDVDCQKSKTGLVCRQMILDDAFIQSLDPAVRAKYLGDITSSWYCAIPVQ